MKNYFIIHALGRTEDDYWYKYIKKYVNDQGYECYVPTLPNINEMNYDSWKKEFDKYKQYINEDSVMIGHSTGSIFIVKYLTENNINIYKFISVVGFNEVNPLSINLSWEDINKSFFVDDLKKFKVFAKERISFYSPTDVYDFNVLNRFATDIDALKIIIDTAGHFTKGYDEFKELLKYL